MFARIGKFNFFWFLLFSFSSLIYAKTYTLAMEVTPPFSNIDPVKGVQGLALDSVNALVEMNGHQLKPIICPFARCLRLIEQGQADFIFGIMKTPERSAYLEYIEPAFITSFSEIRFYTLRDAKTSIKSLADVEKLRVGVQRGASHFEAFDNNKLIRKLDVSSISNLIDMLKKKTYRYVCNATHISRRVFKTK